MMEMMMMGCDDAQTCIYLWMRIHKDEVHAGVVPAFRAHGARAGVGQVRREQVP